MTEQAPSLLGHIANPTLKSRGTSVTTDHLLGGAATRRNFLFSQL